MKKRFWVMLVLSLLIIGLLSSCVSSPATEDENTTGDATNTTFDSGLVVNGDFSENVLGNDENVDFTGWFKYTYDTANEVAIENETAVATVNASNYWGSWEIQLAQWLQNVEPGKTYVLTFKAKSDAESPKVIVAVSPRNKTDANDWPDPYYSEEHTLTADWDIYTVNVNIPAEYDATNYTIKLGFELGFSPNGTYYFDDVSFKEK